VATFASAGCAPHYDGYLRESIARLPSGDEITSEATIIAQFGHPSRTTDAVTVWRRKPATEALVAIEGKGEARVREVGRVLKVQGDTTAFFKSRRFDPHAPAPNVRVSADGNRAWLVRDDKTIASFDYEQGIALFGIEGQPNWATAASR